MKRILITGGPTNEYIDEVMKITNMSSGKIAISMAKLFLDEGCDVTLMITKTVRNPFLVNMEANENCHIVYFETTEQLLNSIETLATMTIYDIIIHSAAVADYKPEFSFRMEDMAKEISDFILDNARNLNEDFTSEDVYNEIFSILTNPDCKVNDDTKISSVEPNLTVKLGLTPKIIARLRQMFPSAIICGFKLLENVPEEELVNAAMKQIQKCNTDLVFANDLAELRRGKAERLVVNKNGYNGVRVDGAEGIVNLLKMFYF